MVWLMCGLCAVRVSGRAARREARREQCRRPLRAAASIGGAERGGLIAVDVDLAEHLAAVHDRHDDLRLRLDAARQIPRIGVHVVDDDRGLLGGGGAADAAAERDARVRRRLADERAEHQLVAVEQVDADPRVVRHLLLEHATARPASRAFAVASVADRRRHSRRVVVVVRVNVMPWSVLDLAEEQQEAAEERHQLEPVERPCSRPNSTRRGSPLRQARGRDADSACRPLDARQTRIMPE